MKVKDYFDFDLCMTLRWTKSHELLTELGMKRDDLSQVVDDAPIALR